MAERAENPYRQFSPGQSLSFTLHTLNPDGSVCLSDKQVEISDVKDGGFFGRVLIPGEGESVIKTSVPDPWHDLWRRVNWSFREFPSQVSETQAKLDYLATNLIADVLPVITNGRFYAPHSLGYTRLPNGYAQVIERVHGRGPRFDTFDNEYESFRQTQPVLTSTGLNLGLEHAAQIHTDNPFGMANLWKDPENVTWVWLDTLPAIPHKGWVWPLFYFRFHKDIRYWFYPETDELTFNRVHPDMFLEEIQRDKHLFSTVAFQRIQDNLALYQELWGKHQKEGLPPKNILGAARAFWSSTNDFIVKAGEIGKTFVVAPYKLITDPNFINDLTLHGVREAYQREIITQTELTQAELSIQDFEHGSSRTSHTLRNLGSISFMTGLYIYYQGLGVALKVPELASYSYVLGIHAIEAFATLIQTGPFYLIELIKLADSPEKGAKLILGYFGWRAFGGLTRYISTRIADGVSSMNLRTAALVSALPWIGDHLAIPAQLGVYSRDKLNSLGQTNNLIWHYTVRNLIAGATAIHPAGGWGTQYEGVLWKTIGRRIESLATPKTK